MFSYYEHFVCHSSFLIVISKEKGNTKGFHNTSIGTLSDKRIGKRYNKYKSKLLIITGDFSLSDSQITKEDKDWLYPQMIQAIKKIVANSINLVFSPTTLSNLVN